MKIMFFIPRMGGGGAERVISILANEFDKLGNSVIIYTPTDSQSYYSLRPSVRIIGENFKVSKKKGIRQILLAFNGIRLWNAYERKIKEEKPEVVISFLTETNLIALTHLNKNYKLIVSERNDPTKYNKIVQVVIKKLYSKADVLVCQSHKVAKYFSSNNTTVIQNPIDISILPEIYKGNQRKVICSVGRLMHQKNFSCLIKAFSYIEKKYEDYTLEIYGEGILHNDLQNLINRLHLNNKVKLMGAHKDVLEKIKDTSLFVMSSDYEGFPNALVEAMAIGLPVICTDFDSGTAKELVRKENGLLVPVGDTHALAKAKNYMLENTEMRKSMSRENIKIRDKLSINVILNKWNTIIT